MILIPIDRDSIRRNERAGQEVSYVCGGKQPISLLLGWRSLPENTTKIILFLRDLIEKDGGTIPRFQTETCGGKIHAVLGPDITEDQAISFSKSLSELLIPLGGILNPCDCELALFPRLEPIYHFPIPSYSFKRVSTDVTCDECGAVFKHTEFESDCMDDGDGGEIYSSTICPKCGHWDCCEVEYERLSDVEMKSILKEREGK